MWKFVVYKKVNTKVGLGFFVFLIYSTSGKGRCENKAHMSICQNKWCDVFGYVLLKKQLVKSFELVEVTCGYYLDVLLDKIKFQAYTFVQVLGFQHANWLCN
jgi:hypothetical protein